MIIGIFLAIYVFLSLWIGLKIWQYIGRFVPYLNHKLYWIIYLLISQSFLLGKLLTGHLPVQLSRSLILMGSYWLAIMSILVLVLLFTDISNAIFSNFNIFQNSLLSSPLSIGIFISFTTLLLFCYGWWNAQNVKLSEYDLKIDKKAGHLKNITAIAVSDLHLGSIVNKNRLEKLAAIVKETNPDIIFFVGDIVDEDPEPFIEQNMKQVFMELKPPLGMYAVPGNHEYIGKKWNEIFDNLHLAGITVLRDEEVLVDNSFYVIGRDDYYMEHFYRQKRKSLGEITHNSKEKSPMILLDHQPVALNEAAENGIDLQLSGHTHHGQFFPNNLITKKIFECDWGYLQKNNLQVIVSCGFGTWGPPIRIGSNSEVLKINIAFQ